MVNDEADARALIKRLLEDRGMEVRIAGSVAEALEQLAAPISVVLISDVGMPGQDGVALSQQVRDLTAYARSEHRLKMLQEGLQRTWLNRRRQAAKLLTLVASLTERVARLSMTLLTLRRSVFDSLRPSRTMCREGK